MRLLKNKFKKFISILLSLIIISSCFAFGTEADDSKEKRLIDFTVNAEKASYEKGETVVLNIFYTNHSLQEIDDLIIWVETDDGETLLGPGVTERSYSDVVYGAGRSGSFNLEENIALLNICGKSGSFLTKVFNKLIHIYMKISKAFVSISKRTEDVKEGKISNASSGKEEESLGSSSFIYDGKEIKCTFKAEYIITSHRSESKAERKCSTDNAYSIEAVVTPEDNALNGIIFGADINEDNFTGGLFYLDSVTGSCGVATSSESGEKVLAQKFIDIEPGKDCKIKLSYNDGYIKGFVYTNSLDEDPYPVFDIYTKFDGTDTGIYASEKDGVKEFKLTDEEAVPAGGETYTNPVYDNSPDPFILSDNGTYYLYATNRSDGFEVSTSEDLINWTDSGACALKGDIIGTHWFWAPEVYRYNGSYYLLYSADKHLALAVADSPLGPFRKTSDNFIFDFDCIDGHILFDDNGSIYLYYACWGDNGEEIHVCRLDENLDPVSGTEEKITEASGWEGTINEGPFVIKHNGYYYLTYSGEESTANTYAIGVAVSDSPTGPFVKQDVNPILYHTAFINGTGHHCFVYSSSGQLYIAYHCHYSDEQVHPRKLCIDKAKFVPTESGIDELVIYGPSSTPQEIPK